MTQLETIAVTGSVGKTTVKEIIKAILEFVAPEKVVATLGNTNNQIGVVQNLFRLNKNIRYAVLEAGTNHHGEIEPLSKIILPNVALVNTIAPCHLEFLKNLDGVAEEKGHIFDGVTKNGYAIIPSSCAGKNILELSAKNLNVLYFGEDEKANMYVQYHGGNLQGSSFTLTFPDKTKHTINWHLSGKHQALNASAAALATWALGINSSNIAKAIPNVKLPGMRLKTTKINNITYINDTYNASPESMISSFKWLSEFIDDDKLILLLGEMKELGEKTQELHSEVLNTAKELFPKARILTIGKLFNGVASSEHAEKNLNNIIKDGDIVFAKGSRGTAVEKALPQEAR